MSKNEFARKWVQDKKKLVADSIGKSVSLTRAFRVSSIICAWRLADGAFPAKSLRRRDSPVPSSSTAICCIRRRRPNGSARVGPMNQKLICELKGKKAAMKRSRPKNLGRSIQIFPKVSKASDCARLPKRPVLFWMSRSRNLIVRRPESFTSLELTQMSTCCRAKQLRRYGPLVTS